MNFFLHLLAGLLIFLLILFLDLFLTLGHLDKLGHIKTVHIVDMWINSSGFLEINVESFLYEFDQALFSDLNSAINNLNKSSFQSVVDNGFIFQG